jgi:hypothetical protein
MPRSAVDFTSGGGKFTQAKKFRMSELGKILVIVGLATAVVGAMLWLGIGRTWFGRLPGDIHYSRDNFSFHFPIVTCLLISIVLTILFWIFRR